MGLTLGCRAKKGQLEDPSKWIFDHDLDSAVKKQFTKRFYLVVIWFLIAIVLSAVAAVIRCIILQLVALLALLGLILYLSQDKIKARNDVSLMPMIAVPVILWEALRLFIKIFRPEETVSKESMLGIGGTYISFVGTFCLGYFIYYRSEKERFAEKRKKVKIILSELNSIDYQIRRLETVCRNDEKIKAREKQGCGIREINYSSNWELLFFDIEPLIKNSHNVRAALTSYYKHIELMNEYLEKGSVRNAVEYHKRWLDLENYSIADYTYFEARCCLMDATTEYLRMDNTPWNSQKEVRDKINTLCRKHYQDIESYIYNRLKDGISDQSNFHREVTDWMINSYSDVKSAVELPSDKRIVYKVVLDCACMMESKSNRVGYVWGEHYLKEEHKTEKPCD